ILRAKARSGKPGPVWDNRRHSMASGPQLNDLVAHFGCCVQISQQVAGDLITKPAEHKSSYCNTDFGPGARRLIQEKCPCHPANDHTCSYIIPERSCQFDSLVAL